MDDPTKRVLDECAPFILYHVAPRGSVAPPKDFGRPWTKDFDWLGRTAVLQTQSGSARDPDAASEYLARAAQASLKEIKRRWTAIEALVTALRSQALLVEHEIREIIYGADEAG